MGLNEGYILSEPAENDLDDIFFYSLQYGDKPAVDYQEKLISTFKRLGKYPNSGITRDDIRKGLRQTISEKHAIFYRIRDGYVFILRILHHSRDVERYF
ncbi:toxin ParE1/3/4 [Ekhidna lutea]|uniref:Toxin n=1 Tax=Ekhidna lutea TaxID=447679 RepID=A0A239KL63_EKHLU|nr:type II toxin-antitoxin system RelE/ParE family toxin [Ekhidna lutea]SNT18805.1 toxin ParE1/3/4 [Ekhidna lutea]